MKIKKKQRMLIPTNNYLRVIDRKHNAAYRN